MQLIGNRYWFRPSQLAMARVNPTTLDNDHGDEILAADENELFLFAFRALGRAKEALVRSR
ncbi:hypothetical protein CKO42_05835 [Lamprobacter modestohalophilus]|uniref:Uncharacterized protein n=1 Tax=Lamprobacter modestohalophilus TaxID=1064514 RepID=A0A9X0W6M7_9GAMM|nr:hypothetical protein [Lamprobacter modestohalophilus]